MSRGRLRIALILVTLCLAGCAEQKNTDDARQAGEQEGPLTPVAVPAASDRPEAATDEAAEPAAVRITQVRADQLRFDPERGETATVHFRIDVPAEVTLVIYDGRDRRVREVEGGRLEAGEHSLAWDGQDGRGRQVPTEAYVYTLEATADSGAPVIHDLTDLTGGEALEVADVEWDPEAGLVRYRTDKPARVNIRLGLQNGGPYLRTLIDWVPRAAGKQAESWDGQDASGVLSLSRHPRLSVGVMAYGLPDNTLLVGAAPDRVSFADLPEEASRPRQTPKGPKRMYHHADQPLETRGDVSASLTLDGITRRDAQGRWIVSGSVPVRLNVADEDRELVLTRRFEPVFFVDGIYAFENEVGFLPMTWHWDTSSVNEGEHFVTVNVRGYDGNFGTATLKVWVDRPGTGSAPAGQEQTRE